ncbi:YihY/virulence factor BrkB family protein [uncultured Tateyamaria sp.]|uniref:YihY/virulence factor BrkB family protein n=1 Tax=Tateyamaria sp. 1078 TaxID=3417464 RepID=UPI00262845F7|nr:YihY/virulence factor BrkB family protein [uncultured Tateyamaria sp.]
MAPGRQAAHPTAIPLKGWWHVLQRVYQRQDASHIGLLAAGVAFYGLLSLFPGIAATVAIAGLLVDPSLITTHAETLADILPESARDIVIGQIREVATADSTSLSLAAAFALALALYSASKAVASLINGFNVVYEEKESRGFVRLTLLKLVLTLGLIIGGLLAVLIVAALPAVAAWFGAALLTDIIMLARWPVVLLIAGAGIAILYRYGPDRRSAKWRWLTPGAGVACVLWVAGSFGFSMYVESFGTYNETFGTLGGVTVLLTWLWLSAFIVLLGGLLDAELEAQTSRDSTVGPDRPMGNRGAVKADTLSTAPAE